MRPGSSTTLDEALTMVKGDYFGGITSFNVTVSGAAPSANVSAVRMQFRKSIDSTQVSAELTSAAGNITITSAANWTFSIARQALALPEGNYIWGMMFTDVNGVIQTYASGTMEVLKQFVI